MFSVNARWYGDAAITDFSVLVCVCVCVVFLENCFGCVLMGGWLSGLWCS